jgi:hypothetical protein
LLDAFVSSNAFIAVNGILESELVDLLKNFTNVVAFVILPNQPPITDRTSARDFPFELCKMIPNWPYRPPSPHEPWGVHVRANTAWQYWGNYVVWELTQSIAFQLKHNFTFYVRARPDLIFPLGNLDLDRYAKLTPDNLGSTSLVSKTITTTFSPFEIDSASDFPPDPPEWSKYPQNLSPRKHILFAGPGGMEPQGISDQFYFGAYDIMKALMSAILHMDPLFAVEGYRYRHDFYFSSEQLLRASVARHFRFVTAADARQHMLFLAVPTEAKWCYRGCHPDVYAAALAAGFTPRYPENQL